MIISQMHLDVNRIDGLAVVRPVGKLDLSSYSTLRDGLLKLATEEPPALIVRLDSDFSVTTPSILAVFSTVWMRVSEWPGVPVLLVPETARHRELLRRSGVTRFVSTYQSLRCAFESVNHPARRRVDRLALDYSLSAAYTARAFVRAACVRWRIPRVSEDAVLVANELVENAVKHAKSASRLRLELRPGTLSVAVHDCDARPPRPRRRGHGVDLVNQVSRIWGWAPSFDGGKVVWAVLTLP